MRGTGIFRKSKHRAVNQHPPPPPSPRSLPYLRVAPEYRVRDPVPNLDPVLLSGGCGLRYHSTTLLPADEGEITRVETFTVVGVNEVYTCVLVLEEERRIRVKGC